MVTAVISDVSKTRRRSLAFCAGSKSLRYRYSNNPATKQSQEIGTAAGYKLHGEQVLVATYTALGNAVANVADSE